MPQPEEVGVLVFPLQYIPFNYFTFSFHFSGVITGQ